MKIFHSESSLFRGEILKAVRSLARAGLLPRFISPALFASSLVISASTSLACLARFLAIFPRPGLFAYQLSQLFLLFTLSSSCDSIFVSLPLDFSTLHFFFIPLPALIINLVCVCRAYLISQSCRVFFLNFSYLFFVEQRRQINELL